MVSGRGGTSDGDLVEVELDDEAAPRDRGTRGGRPAGGPRRRLSARTWSRVAVPLAGVLAVGVGLDGVSAADLAVSRDGRVADLRAPRLELWRAPASGLFGPIGLVGDEVLLVTADGEGVQARGVRDGALRWSRPFVGCQVVDPEARPSQPDVARLTALPVERARLLCSTATAGDGTAQQVIAAAVDGTVLATISTPTEWGPFQAEGVAVVPGLATGGRQPITAYSLRTGELLWTSSVEAGGDGSLDTRDGAIVLGGASALDLHTGAAVPVPAGARVWHQASLPGGAAMRVRWAETAMTVEVLGPDGAVRWSTPGSPQTRPDSRDASVVLVQPMAGDGLEARDVADGALLWSTDRMLNPIAELAGVLVAADLSDVQGDLSADDATIPLVGLDARTGEQLWLTQAAEGALWSASVVTDGIRVAVATDEGVDIVDSRTGAVAARWRVPAGARQQASDGITHVLTGPGSGIVSTRVPTTLTPLPDGRLLLMRGMEAVVLGW
jgi:outer membrane protein assembly factor BamB